MASKSKKAVGGKNPEMERLEQVFALMARHEIVELDWETSQGRIHAKTTAAPGQWVAAPVSPSAPAKAAAPATSAHSAAPAPAVAAAPAHAANVKQVVSPFVGTFYRSSSPGAAPYAKEGQVIKRGDKLCIIEAMKLMNEIEAEFAGKVMQVLVENGQPVEFGEPLFLIET